MSGRARSVILVGFMGVGKSTVGRLLARRLGLCFVETDAMIAAREGRSIPEIFAHRGEAYFRQLEAETLEQLATKQGHVIATGGGFACRPGAMERLLELGTVVWLSADVSTAYERACRVGGRPMLAGRSVEEIAELHRAREAYYRLAHLSIDTTHLSVDAVVARIVRHMRDQERAAGGAMPGGSRPAGGPAVVAGRPEGNG
jgi:shikimate kinase